MTTTSIDRKSELLAELSKSDTSCEMMIGIGLVKDSDAVFFEYLGNDGESRALRTPNDKPLTRIGGVTLRGVSIAESIGEYESTKLNLRLVTPQGYELLMTSGLTTWWSRCVLTGLMGLLASGLHTEEITIDTWKGNQGKYKPCFAAIRCKGQKITHQEMYDALKEAKSDGDNVKLESICRDAALVLEGVLKIDEPTMVQVNEIINEGDF